MGGVWSHDVRFVHAGAKLLEHSEAKGVPCDYRILQEGVDIVAPHMKKHPPPLKC
jgi:hypothetical protein